MSSTRQRDGIPRREDRRRRRWRLWDSFQNDPSPTGRDGRARGRDAGRDGRAKEAGGVSGRLEGKVVIVTGGAQGIGKAYALRLGDEGAKVVVADIKDARAVAEMVAAGGESLTLLADVTDEESTREMAAKTVERFGRIDVLVNNAAFF